jgi:hypothetical protein
VTGNKAGPLPFAKLQSHPDAFGLSHDCRLIQELVVKAQQHRCPDIDYTGLLMLLLCVHLTEPHESSAGMPPAVRCVARELLRPYLCRPMGVAKAEAVPRQREAVQSRSSFKEHSVCALPPRTMLGCLEGCFTHFSSVRRGRLDKREVRGAVVVARAPGSLLCGLMRRRRLAPGLA